MIQSYNDNNYYCFRSCNMNKQSLEGLKLPALKGNNYITYINNIFCKLTI